MRVLTGRLQPDEGVVRFDGADIGVDLAAAILRRPEVLVLDEPTEGLDPNQRVGIRQLIRHPGRDRTVLLSTHVLAEVEEVTRRVRRWSRSGGSRSGSSAATSISRRRTSSSSPSSGSDSS